MKNKLSNLLLIPSSVAMMLLMSDGELKYCLAAIVLGLVIGTVLSLIRENQSNVMNKTERLVSFLLAILFCFVLSNVFYKTWINHPYKMKELVELVVPNYKLGLRIISLIIAITAVPAAAFFFSLFVPDIMRSVREELFKDFSVTSFLKRGTVVVLCLVLSALLGYVMLIGSYLIPVGPIEENVRRSAYTVQAEGTFPTLTRWATSDLDNYTDAIMLLEAAAERQVSASVDSMNVPHGIIDGKDYVEIMVDHYLNGEDFDGQFQYARYWHGYLIWLKPLLTVLEYSQIRTVNGMLQIFMIAMLCLLLVKRGLRGSVIPVLLSYMMLMPFALAKSFQFSSCFYACILGGIVLLSAEKKKYKTGPFIVFLFIGIFTAYFDFLTYPIATFGVPALIWLMITRSERTEKKYADMLVNGFCWSLGYLGMWTEKWIMASILTENDIIQNAIRAVRERTGTVSLEGGAYYGVLSCEAENYLAFFRTPVTVLAVGFAAYIILKYVRRIKAEPEKTMQTVLPFVLVGLLPAVWYTLTLNHSTNHFWFTNKACVVSFLAALLCLACLAEDGQPGED